MLGTDARGAGVKHGVHMFEAGNADDMLVGMKEVVVAGVAKALVPEKALGGLREGKDRDIVMRRRELVSFIGRRLGSKLIEGSTFRVGKDDGGGGVVGQQQWGGVGFVVP